jgi:hypothetical protein
MNGILGKENHIGTFVWKRRSLDTRSKSGISIDHEYVLGYGKSERSKLLGRPRSYDKFSNPDNDSRGPWMSRSMKNPLGKDERPNLHYTITDPESGNKFTATWICGKEKMENYIKENKVLFPDDEEGTPRRKYFQSELDSEYKNVSTWISDTTANDKLVERETNVYDLEILRTGRTEEGTKSTISIFGDKVYDFPKPPSLMRQLIRWTVDDGDIVLDFFAGSGTTAQAVQELNRKRDEQVNYILVEMLDEAFEITEERVKRTAFSKEWKDGKPQLDESDTPLDLSVESIYLESYEDALDAVTFENNNQTNLGSFNPSTLQYTLDFGTKGSSVFVDTSQFSKPLEYSLEGTVRDTPINLLTTFNYLIGLQGYEKRTRTISDVEYTMFEGEVNGSSVLVVWRHNVESVDYNKEQDVIQAGDFDKVYVNGDSQLDGSIPIGKVFTQKMLNKGGTL